MQISHASLAQFVANTVNQHGNRLPARPVTIEGQLVDDEKKKSGSGQAVEAALERPERESQTQLIQAPSQQEPGSGDFNKTLLAQELSQTLLTNNQANRPAAFGSQADISRNEAEPSAAEQNFPYTNRRSVEGRAGSSLVIQNYLNNQPPAASEPESFQGGISFFV